MLDFQGKAKKRSRRISKVRQQRRLRFLIVISIVAVLVIGLVLIYNSSLFDIKKVKISGSQHIANKRVLELARIDQQTNLFKLDVDGIKNRLLAESWLKEVSVVKQYPDTLEIKMVERKPFCLVELKGGLFVIDEDHFVLEKLASAQGVSLPLIKELKVSSFPVGKKVYSSSLSNAILCLHLLDKDLYQRINFVLAPSVERLTLITKEGIEILYGKAENCEKKNAAIKEFLATDGQKIIFIDVRVPSNPAVRRLGPPAD